MVTVQILITGKVQGVFYRASAKEEAEKLALTGWVKNTDDGHVLSVVSGASNAVEAFIQWCHHGPSQANVHEVIVKPLELTHFDKFSVHR